LARRNEKEFLKHSLVAEVQLHHDKFLTAKDTGHGAYEIQRELGDDFSKLCFDGLPGTGQRLVDKPTTRGKSETMTSVKSTTSFGAKTKSEGKAVNGTGWKEVSSNTDALDCTEYELPGLITKVGKGPTGDKKRYFRVMRDLRGAFFLTYYDEEGKKSNKAKTIKLSGHSIKFQKKARTDTLEIHGCYIYGGGEWKLKTKPYVLVFDDRTQMDTWINKFRAYQKKYTMCTGIHVCT